MTAPFVASGARVAFGGVRGAAALRANADTWPGRGRRRASVPRPRDRPLATAQPSACPEIDCVRDLLPSRVVVAAERRARAIGLGADRVLICADAMTEDAYLMVLAASLGTSYEPLERISRADCPLDDDQLVQAASAGLWRACSRPLTRPVRCFPARPGGAAPAVSAWRLVEPFSYGRVVPSRRLGPL